MKVRKGKKKQNELMFFGKKPVLELLEEQPERFVRIFLGEQLSQAERAEFQSRAKAHRIPVSIIGKKRMEQYIGDVQTQGVLAVIRSFPYWELDDFLEMLSEEYGEGTSPAVLILDQIQDPHNFGAILRTAAATGIAGVIIAKDRQAPVNGTVFKTSAGAALRIPIVRVSNLRHAILKLKKRRFWVYALDASEGTRVFWDESYVNEAHAFILGSEGKGVSRGLLEESDGKLMIPMERGVESLNVSVAAALILYEWKKQQYEQEKGKEKV